MASSKRTAVIVLAVSILSAVSAGAQEWTRCTSGDGDVKIEVAVVNINAATAEQLAHLYRVGEKTAARIIEGRPYAAPVDVLRVKGLGPAWWRANGLHVTTEGETTLTAKVGGTSDEAEPLSWQCDDGRHVELVVEESESVTASAARRVVQ